MPAACVLARRLRRRRCRRRELVAASESSSPLALRRSRLRDDGARERQARTGPNVFPLPEFFTVGPLHIGIGKVRLTNARAVGFASRTQADPRGPGHGRDGTAGGRGAGESGRSTRCAWTWWDTASSSTGSGRRPARRRPRPRSPDRLALARRAAAPRGRATPSVGRVPRAIAPCEGRCRSRRSRRRPASTGGSPVRPKSPPRSRAPSQRQVGGRIQIPELGIDGIAVHEVGTDVRWADRRLRLDNLRARLGAGRVRGTLEAAATLAAARASRSTCARSCCPETGDASVPAPRSRKARSTTASSSCPG